MPVSMMAPSEEISTPANKMSLTRRPVDSPIRISPSLSSALKPSRCIILDRIKKEDQRYDDAGHGGHDGRVGLLALAIEQQQRHGDGEDRAQDADRDRRISREYHRQQHADDQIQAVCQTEDRLHALALRDEHDGQDEHGDAECHRDGAVIIVQRVIWLDPFRLIDIDDDRHALADFALVRIGDIVGHFDLFSLVFPLHPAG